jgi:hypothetical protein
VIDRLAGVALLLLIATGGPVSAQPDVSGANALAGAWRLVSWQEHLASGATRSSRFTTGSLIYSDSGRICAQLMDPQRPKLSQSPTDAEIRASYQGFVAYCGRYDVHAKEGFVIHHVELDKSPNVVGRERKRWFRFEGPNRLVLKIDAAELGQGLAESTLTWERVTK